MSDAQWLASWPALTGLPRAAPALVCERGVLGKEPGGAADFHWIAASPGFSGPTSDLACALALGGEDVVRATLLWRGAGRLCQAVRCYPARAPDAQGRPFLEKQVLEWVRPLDLATHPRADLPAALGALVMLPLAVGLDAGVWQDRPRDPFAERLFVGLEPLAVPPAALDPAVLGETIRAGIAELARRFRPADLGLLYARLLAGERAVFPRGVGDPLGPAALPVLLLPLPRLLADRLAVIGWLPSTRPDPEALRRHWDLVLGADGGAPPPGESAPEPGVAARGLALAQALLGADPRALREAPQVRAPAPATAALTVSAPGSAPGPLLGQASGRASYSAPGPASGPAGPAPTRLALWGPSGSGKTVFLAQLYWQLSGSQDHDWVVFPGETGLDFLELMRDTLYSQNAFPPGTPPGTSLAILCHLAHRQTGERVTLALEDRAGSDYEALHPEVAERLLAADGIILLLDPRRQDDRVFNEVSHTCERILLAAGAAAGRAATRDPRPVAVCLTKADELLKTPEDWRAALTDPAGFAAAHTGERLRDYLETRFERLALFPVSAAGVRMRFGAVEPVVFYDEQLRPRINCGQPFNLLAPIDWLIRQVRP